MFNSIDGIMALDYQLFLGFYVSDAYLVRFNQVSSALRATFIHAGADADYLQQIEYEGQIYLGKYLEPIVEFSSLELIQANIYSLLKRLIDDYPYENYPLMLMAIKKP